MAVWEANRTKEAFYYVLLLFLFINISPIKTSEIRCTLAPRDKGQQRQSPPLAPSPAPLAQFINFDWGNPNIVNNKSESILQGTRWHPTCLQKWLLPIFYCIKITNLSFSVFILLKFKLICIFMVLFFRSVGEPALPPAPPTALRLPLAVFSGRLSTSFTCGLLTHDYKVYTTTILLQLRARLAAFD